MKTLSEHFVSRLLEDDLDWSEEPGDERVPGDLKTPFELASEEALAELKRNIPSIMAIVYRGRNRNNWLRFVMKYANDALIKYGLERDIEAYEALTTELEIRMNDAYFDYCQHRERT
jgi:hypothetical protein